MKIMGKCPFWGEPCLKEGCSAFEYISHCLWDDKDHVGYRAFEKKLKKSDYALKNRSDSEWFAVEIPYCRVLEKELPVKVEKDIK